MNEAGRTFPVESARTKEIVFYSEFARIAFPETPLNSDEGQAKLKQELIAISKFEYGHKRPLLSSFAINIKNEHGNGFYELAQELGFGNAGKLRAEQWGFIEAQRVKAFWRDDTNYRKFATLRAVVSASTEPQPAYFTAEELNFFTEWQHKPYDPQSLEHVQAKNTLMETVWDKTIFLGKAVTRRFPGFKLQARRTWSQRGWKPQDGRNVQAAIVKPYTWVKMFREEYEDKDIFITFGLDADPNVEAFISKIDCQSSRDSTLNARQIEIFRKSYPEFASWDYLSFEQLLLLNWDQLIDRAVAFVVTRIEEYDEIVKTVWGEDLVVTYEKDRLRRFGPTRCIDLVKKMQDGEGFDVLSFNERGERTCVEVKTTTGNAQQEFYLLENEVDFMRANKGPYRIYRLFNYDPVHNVADYFTIDGDVESKLKMEATQYAVTYVAGKKNPDY